MYVFPRLVAASLALGLITGPLPAETLPAPTGPIILTVTGLDPEQYPGGSVAFDHALLSQIGHVEFATSSIWTDGVHRYGGVLLKDLAEELRIADRVLRLHALNDYAVDFPVQEATEEGPILAYHSDGAPMSVRDKGPIWVIYPYDAGPQYRTDTTFSRSIWQLDRIDVLR